MSNKNRLLILNNAGRVFRPVFILPILAVIFHGCGSGSSDNSSSFDRSSLLSNYCDNIIIPGYEDFYNKSIQLHESVVLYTHHRRGPPIQATVAGAAAQIAVGCWVLEYAGTAR